MGLTLEVPLSAVAFRGMVRVGRPLGLQGSVAGDVNPREGGHVCMVAARGWCAPEHGTRRRETPQTHRLSTHHSEWRTPFGTSNVNPQTLPNLPPPINNPFLITHLVIF